MRSRLPDRCGPVGARARPTNHRSGSPSAGHYSSQAESPHQPRIALARHQAAGCRGRFIIPGVIRIDLTGFSVGNAPGFGSNLAEGPLEDLINEALADVTLDHGYAFSVEEINAELSGTP